MELVSSPWDGGGTLGHTGQAAARAFSPPTWCFWPSPHSTVVRTGLEPHWNLSFPLLSAPAPNKCELTCIPKGESFYYKHREAVVDGTPCEPGKRDICVDGSCRVSCAFPTPTPVLTWGLLQDVSLPCTSRASGPHELDVFSRQTSKVP